MPDGSSTQPVNSRIILSGAGAGLTVDLVLFPIDTIKSRIQSKQGFLRSGGFSNPYRGLSPVLAGSIPTCKFLTFKNCNRSGPQNSIINKSIQLFCSSSHTRLVEPRSENYPIATNPDLL